MKSKILTFQESYQLDSGWHSLFNKGSNWICIVHNMSWKFIISLSLSLLQSLYLSISLSLFPSFLSTDQEFKQVVVG